MKFRASAFVLLSVSLLFGGTSCSKSSASREPASQTAQQQDDQSAKEDSSNNENASSSEAELKTAPDVDEAKDVSKNANRDSKPKPRNAPPASISKGATQVQMRNVDFHTEEPIVLRIRELRGALLRKNKATPPVFDDKRSFILRIDSGTVGIRTDSLTHLMNNYVFAYPRAPLKKLSLTTEGSQVKMSGKVHKGITVPFKIVGNLTATPEGKIRLHPTSIKAAGIPVKGLMKVFGLELDELLKTSQARGVSIDDNDIIMDPELMLPPPAIRGRITAVRVEGNEVVQDFGGKSSSGRSPSTNGSNYMYFRGGTLRFGKLTMNNADLRIIDASPKDIFDFSLDHYNSQLVAGHSKNTPNFGLVVVMPDYYKLRQASTKQPRVKDADTTLSRR
jgi:hypothetical protein